VWLPWRHGDKCGCTALTCLVYDNAEVSLSVLGLAVAWRAVGVGVMAKILYFPKRSGITEVVDEEDGGES